MESTPPTPNPNPISTEHHIWSGDQSNSVEISCVAGDSCLGPINPGVISFHTPSPQAHVNWPSPPYPHCLKWDLLCHVSNKDGSVRANLNNSDVTQDATGFCVECPLLKLTSTMKVRAIVYIHSWHTVVTKLHSFQAEFTEHFILLL